MFQPWSETGEALFLTGPPSAEQAGMVRVVDALLGSRVTRLCAAFAEEG